MAKMVVEGWLCGGALFFFFFFSAKLFWPAFLRYCFFAASSIGLGCAPLLNSCLWCFCFLVVLPLLLLCFLLNSTPSPVWLFVFLHRLERIGWDWMERVGLGWVEMVGMELRAVELAR
ncbi:hypothetical protein HDK77DRAFT_254402 [Phyllosticta capitalensis]